MRQRVYALAIGAVAAAALAAAGLFPPADPAPDPGYRATRVEAVPAPLIPFELVDQHARPFTLDRLYRHWSFAMSLPQPCAAPCRDRLATLSAALERWVAANGFGNSRVLLVPERPVPTAELALLSAGTDRRFVALTGAPEALRRLRARLFPEGGRPGLLAVVDPLGRVLATVRPPYDDAGLERDYARLRERYGAECCVAGGERPLEVLIIRGRDAGAAEAGR